MHPIFQNFHDHLLKKYFSQNASVLERLSANLISPFILKLPASVLKDAKNIASDLQKLYTSPLYRARVQKDFPFDINKLPDTPSVLNSLDVHLDEDNQLRIIEVNTNASSYLINTENYTIRNIKSFAQPMEDLKKIFVKTFGERLKPGNLFLVLDEKPEQQNLYVEFLLFQQFFKTTFGVDCEIADPNELTLAEDQALLYKGRKVAGIYNRFTDFYFATNANLATAYQAGKTLISPNPLTYGLLADKNRFFILDDAFFNELKASEGLDLAALQKAILHSRTFGSFSSREELWKNRGRYFFKPPNSYGGKAVYKGKSISRTVFERIYDDNYIAQEAAPAPEADLEYMGDTQTFKYDLRFYFFEAEIQLGVARIYQGQLTNLKTPLGGLTPIEFSK